MQNHIKNYLNFFGFKLQEDCECEVCGSPAQDIHHIIPRSKFGSKRKDEQDDPKNLIALCRLHHDASHAEEFTKEDLKEIHKNYIKQQGKTVE